MSTIQFDNGTKVQFDGTPTPADVEEVAQKIGIGAPAAPDTRDFLQKTSDVVNSIFPNKNMGAALGTPLGGILTAITDPKDLKNYDWNPHVTPGGMVGDLAGDAINLGSLAMAPETGGTSLLARSGVNAGIGAGLSLSNSASQGQNLLSPGALMNAGGTATLSAILPALAKPLEGFLGAAKEASGVSPQIETALRGATPAEIQENKLTVMAHNKDLNTPTATGLMASKMNEATDIITSKLKVAGQAVGDAIRSAGAKILGTSAETGNAVADDVLSNFNKKVESSFGHEITIRSGDSTSIKIGGETMSADKLQEPTLAPLEGRSRAIAPGDQSRILKIHSMITDLGENPTVAKASDVIHNLDDLIDYSKVDQVGINHDPLQGIILSTRGEVNGAIREAAPEVAAANDRFSMLKGIEEEIGEKAGPDMQRAALVMRRVFSGDQSGKALQLFNDIKNETGIDLIKHSALAKFATDVWGNASSKSLLQQELNEGGSMLGGMKRALLAPLKNTARAVLVPNAEKYATRIANGGKYANMLDELINSNAGRGFLRTYFNNVSAAHPEIGKGIDRSIGNLIGNVMGR